MNSPVNSEEAKLLKAEESLKDSFQSGNSTRGLSNLQQRLLTALLLLGPVLYASLLAPWWVFLPFLMLIIGLCLYEYFALAEKAGLGGYSILGYAAGLAFPVGQLWVLKRPEFSLLPLVGLLAMVVPLAALGFEKNVRRYATAAPATLFGIFYVAFGLSWLVQLRFHPEQGGPMLVVLLFAVVWMGDVGAYFVGRSVGRTQLAPSISPKKTVEGSLGGFAGSLLAGAVLLYFFGDMEKLPSLLIVCALVGLVGQAGDLAESALKRAADTKDSSALLPGHGGVLDRVDSLIAAAPAMWFLISVLPIGRLGPAGRF